MLKKNVFNRHTLFWIICFCALLGLTLPILIQDGMFMDAILYTSVSHNLAQGIGTFWFPQFSKFDMSGLHSFHEQPPLVFGIQSLFFRLFGDSMYVERLYTFLTMCVTAILINLLWKSIFRHNESLKRMGWLPILLWITIPDCFWSYSNNMHENTMCIFILISVLLTYNFLNSDKQNFINFILPGIFIFFATFSKGLPGLFPVAVPFIFWLINRSAPFSKVVFQSATLLGVPILIYAILICFSESRESLSIYFFKRALHRINADPTTDNRFYTLLSLSQELLAQLLFTVLILSIAWFKKIKVLRAEHWKVSAFFILVGLAGSFPLMLTMVQKAFYYVPSLPFFATGLAIAVAPPLMQFIESINITGTKYKIAIASASFLLAAVITFSLLQAGKASRDVEKLHDVYIIKNIVPKGHFVSVPDRMMNDWSLQCYLMRYGNISVETGNKTQFYLVEKNNPADDPSDYKKVNVPTLKYDLFLK